MVRSVRAGLKKQARKEAGSDDFSGRLVTVQDSAGTGAEAYRTLRTSLLYAMVDVPPKVVVVTSSGPMEGKSTTCANLGVVLAQADKSTLLIDCDLRRPTMHKIFGMRNFHGIANVLSGEVGLPEIWKEPVLKLKVVTAGPVPPNPAELLGSRRFSELIDKARQTFDYVLIDAPPTELVADPMILANQGDGVLLVLDSQRTRKGALRKAIRGLEGVGANVLGTVMNNVDPSKGGYYGYTY